MLEQHLQQFRRAGRDLGVLHRAAEIGCELVGRVDGRADGFQQSLAVLRADETARYCTQL